MRPGVVIAQVLLLAYVAADPGYAQAVAVSENSTDTVSSEASVLHLPARLDVTNVPLAAALNQLSERSGVAVAFSPSRLANEGVVDCGCANVSIKEALDRLLAATTYRYTVVDAHIVVIARPSLKNDFLPSRLYSPHTSYSAASLVMPSAVSEQGSWLSVLQTGTIAGQVVERRTRRPLAGAQVVVEGAGIGRMSNPAGRYLLTGVPVGEVTVSVELIGYSTAQQTVRVASGETTVADFELSVEVLALDEVLVTGTAGQARRREVGNVIEQVRMDHLTEPVRDLGQVLQGRVAGALISQQGGSSAGGIDIRLRGNVSLTMSNQPLIYIDGVRMRNERYPSEGQLFLGAGADNASPLGDINPADIDRIEIVKGPAATTLYGSEAAAGVIQIFTKSGATGDPVITAEIQQGASYFRPWGTKEVPYIFADPVLRTGHVQGYQLSARGGTEGLSYFVSGRWDDNEGAIMTDWEKRASARANLRVQLYEKLAVEFNSSLTARSYRNVRLGNSVQSVIVNAARGDFNFVGGRAPESLLPLLDFEGGGNIDRRTTGFTATYTPTDNFTHRFTIGHDAAQFEGRLFWPYEFVPGEQGRIQRHSNQTKILSVDYVGTLGFDLRENLRSTLSWGLQGVQRTEASLYADGRQLPGSGEFTVSGASQRLGWESELRVITGGFFVQEMLGLNDRYFLTLGLRVDGNSAFGGDLGLEPYPKASLSYVISDEAFWPGWLGQAKLRGAYGLAGRAPGAFDAVRTWNPVAFAPGVSAFVPGTPGNPALGPERTREFEVGFDASLLRDRVGVDFTYYSQTTSDALFGVSRPGSEGGFSAQPENVGEISNRGFEVMLNATVIERSSFGWDVGIGVSTNKSEVVSLGGAPPFQPPEVGNSLGWVMEGEPAPVRRGMLLLNRWEVAEPEFAEFGPVGPVYPTNIWNVNSSVTLPGGINFSGRGEFRGGFWVYNFAEVGPLTRTIPYPKCFDAYRKVDPNWELGTPGNENLPPSGSRDALYAWERAECFGMQSAQMGVSKGDYFELRDLTLAVPVSRLVPSLTSWATSQVDLTISARNVWLWRNKDLMTGHPEGVEATGGSGTYATTGRIGETLPPASFFTVSLRAVR